MKTNVELMGISFGQMFKSLLREVVREELQELKAAIHDKLNHRHEPEGMTAEGALEFLNANGYKISKAQLYKETSTNGIPFRKFGNQLHFKREELRAWAEARLINGNAIGHFLPAEMPLQKGGGR